MSTIKKGQLTAPSEWAKHLRPEGKQEFWGGERAAEREEIRAELVGDGTDPAAKPPRNRSARRARFGIEIRFTFNNGSTRRREWAPHHHWYATAKQRDQAIEQMKKSSARIWWGSYEYRPVER